MEKRGGRVSRGVKVFGRLAPPRRLVECWRTAPYLHDGSAATMREVLTTKRAGDRHGRTSQLSAREIEELAGYVLSL